MLDLASLPHRVAGAVQRFEPSSSAPTSGVMRVRLDTGAPVPFGELVFDVSGESALARSWDGAARVAAEIRVAPAFAGDFGRPHRARVALEDANGKRMYLPNRLLADRPSATDGWIRLGGRPTTRVPIPLGHTDDGFDASRVVAIAINVEAGKREGVVVDDAIEVRDVRVTFGEDTTAAILPVDDAILEGEADRAARMEARLNERLGARASQILVGVNLPYPGPVGPEGKPLQLYGVFLHQPRAWGDVHWDMRHPPVVRALRDDFRAIRRVFGAGALVRVCLFGDLRAGMTFDDDGTPREVTPEARASLRVLLDTAARERVLLIPMLVDFLMADGVERQGPDGAWEVGERPELVTDARKRAALFAAFESMIREVAGHRAVLAWEVMNEPENAEAVVTPESFVELQRFLAEGVDAIHRAGELATVGHRNPLDAARYMRGRLATDLGQAHFYPRFETAPAPFDLGHDARAAFGAVPHGWGETPLRPDLVADELVAARDAGHRYVMFWSWRGDDSTGDGFAVRAHERAIRDALRRVRSARSPGSPARSSLR